MQTVSQTTDFSLFSFSRLPLSLKFFFPPCLFLSTLCLDVLRQNRLAFSLMSVSIPPSVLTYSPSRISLSLLSLPLVFSSFIPLALSQFCSRWRRILWEAASAQRHTKTRKESGGNRRQEWAWPFLCLVLPWGALSPSTHNFTSSHSGVLFVCVLRWI